MKHVTRSFAIRGVIHSLMAVALGMGHTACGAAGAGAWEESSDAGVRPDAKNAPDAVNLSTKPEAAPPAATCGDGVCDSSESCTTCRTDCGECPACNLAPSCSDGLALPSHPKSLKASDLSKSLSDVSDAGASSSSSCTGADLRLRIARIEVGHQGKNVWLPTGTLDGPAQSYYCILQATDGAIASTSDAGNNGTIEVAITKPTAQIEDHSGADFGPSDSIFWGQAGPRLTQANLTLTYSCFQQKTASASAWADVFKAAGQAAGGVENAGSYGWAFGLGDVALQTVGAAIDAADKQGDWHMFDVTTTIDKSWLYDLTNGRRWSFTQSGGDSAFHNPWSITVYTESWGCSNVKAPPPK